MTRYTIAGVNRSEQETVKGKIDLVTGRILDDNIKAVATKRIRDHYVEKGFLDVDIAMEQESDTLFANGTKLRIRIDKGEKVKIDRIAFHGVEAMDTEVLSRKMKDTKERRWWRFYKASSTSRQLPNRLGQRGQSLPQRGIPQCTRAARQLEPQRGSGLGCLGGGRQPVLLRGHHIHWKHEVQTTQLDSLLDIQRGEVFSMERLETRVFMDPKGLDLSSSRPDDGYLVPSAPH